MVPFLAFLFLQIGIPGTAGADEALWPIGSFFFRCLTRRVPPSWPAVVFLWPGRSVRHQ
jgi:hypothetical protein